MKITPVAQNYAQNQNVQKNQFSNEPAFKAIPVDTLTVMDVVKDTQKASLIKLFNDFFSFKPLNEAIKNGSDNMNINVAVQDADSNLYRMDLQKNAAEKPAYTWIFDPDRIPEFAIRDMGNKFIRQIDILSRN